MKKVFAAALAALVSLTAFAQSFAIEDGEVTPATSSEESGNTKLKYIGEFGFGFHIMKDGDAAFLNATPAFGKNREIFFSLFGAEYKPVQWVGISAMADLNWDAYRLNKEHYWLPSNGSVTIADVEGSNYTEIKKSVLRSFGFDFPVELRLHLGDVDIAAGVVGELNFSGRTRFKAVDLNGGVVKNTPEMRVKDIQSNPFTYSYRASFSYSGIGLYVKYSPASQFKVGAGPQFSYWSVGLIM